MNPETYERIRGICTSENNFRRTLLAYHIYERALQFGDYALRSGMRSGYKLDLERLSPDALDLTAEILADMMGDEIPDAVAGVPNGGNPIADRIAKKFDIPLIPTYKKGESVVAGRAVSEIGNHAYIFEDVATTGGSTVRTVDAVTHYGRKRGRILLVPRAYAVVRRMEGDPALMLKERGVDFDFIFSTGDLLAHFTALHANGLIKADDRWRTMSV